MTSILADQPAVSQCPAWCAGHLEGDDGAVHISKDRVVATSSGRERGEVYVSVEQAPGIPTAVRLAGAADRPMSPAQAVQIGFALIAFAIHCTPECDDMFVPGAATGPARGFHHDDCPWAALLTGADLARKAVTR